MEKIRCAWASNEILQQYHDTEWGIPVHDDRTLFEYLILEGAQAGLSWQTILQRREGYRSAFANFDPAVVATYDQAQMEALHANPGIIRNRLKIAATVTNAQAFLKVQTEFGSFDRYIWGFVDADTMSRDLKRRGFKFVGPTICYAFMQAAGMVNDHTVDCFRFNEVTATKGEAPLP
jgi:DNA-3-methyladenine glycosylase I